MAEDSTPCNFEDIQSAFIEAPKNIYPVITSQIRDAKKLFTNLIPRGNFDYGAGYTGYVEEFYGGLGIQDGAASWQVMEKFRAPLTNGPDDPGYNPCKSNALIVNYGIEEKQWMIYQTERRTEDICLTDALFKWHLAETLALRYQALAQVSVNEWEQVLSRAYEYFCAKNLCRTSTVNTASGLDTFTLTAGTGAVFGGSIAIPAGGLGTIGTLNQSVLDRVYAMLVRAVDQKGYIGMNGMIPLLGVAASQETLGDIIKQDAKEIAANYWAEPNINVEGYGPMHTYKNWVWMNDWNAVRYMPNAAGTALIAVYPYKTAPATIGELEAVNPDYLNAPFEMVRIIVRNVFTAQVPPPNPASIGAYKFNPVNNIMEWEFWNHIDRCDNPRGEIGFFLSRARMAPKPERNSQYCMEILCRRCTIPTFTQCANCGSDAGVASTFSAAPVSFGDQNLPANEHSWILVLNECLNVQVGDRVVLTETAPGNTVSYGIISDNWAGTTVTVLLDTAADISTYTAGTLNTTTQARA